MKKKIIQLIFVLLASLLVFVIVDNDVGLYQKPVGKIVSVQTTNQQKIEDNYQNTDLQITQALEIKLLNQSKTKVVLTNEVAQSQVTGQVYRVGQQVILQKIGNHYEIMTLKRDALLAAMVVLFVGILLLLTQLRFSVFLMLSLLLNLLYFVVVVLVNVNFTPPVLVLFGFLSLVFAASSLLFVIGPNRQMLYALLTTVLTTLLTFTLVFLVLSWTGNAGVHFEYLEYVTQNPAQFFFVGTMISVLGAIMDGTGDIVAGLFGLSRQNQLNQIQLTFHDYVRSGFSIGQEIIGTLTNVLFMIFMAEAFPMLLLLLRNGNSWDYIASVGLNLGLLQTLISAIGIVLAVPVTSFVTSFGIVFHEKKEGL